MPRHITHNILFDIGLNTKYLASPNYNSTDPSRVR